MKTNDAYHQITDEIEDYAIVLLNEKGDIKDWNKGAEKLKGYKPQEIIGKNFSVFYTKEDQKKNLPKELIKQATLNGKASNEGWRVRKDDSFFWGNILITALHDQTNNLIGFLKITRDLTERKSIEDKLIKMNEELELQVKERTDKLTKTEIQFRHTLDNMLEGAQMHDFNWRYIYVNNALVKSSTYTKHELLGYTIMEKYPGIEQTDLFKVLQKCMKDRETKQIKTEFDFPNGTKAFFELSIQPIPEGIFILSVDITERKNAEEKLLKSNRLYSFLSNINKSIVQIIDEQELLDNVCTVATEIAQFKLAYVGMLDEHNKLNIVSLRGDKIAAERILKQSGLDYSDPIHQNIPTIKTLQTGKYVINNDMQNDPSLSHWKDDLELHGIHASVSLPIFKFGKVAGIIGLHSSVKHFFDTQELALLDEAAGDISFALEIFEKGKKQKETEQLVVNTETRFRSLIEKSNDMKTLTSLEGKFIYASPSISKVFEYSEEEFLHKSVFDFFHPDDIPDLITKRNILLKTPGESFPFQYRLLHKDKRWIWCEGTLTNMLHEPSINALVSNFRDISEKKIAEEEREFDKNNLNALINNTRDLLWSIDRNFKLITFNKPFYEVIKHVTGKELKKGDDVFDVVLSQEQLNLFKSLYLRAFSGEIFTNVEYIESPAETWIETSYYPIYKGDEVVGTACHSRDITERKKTEFEREKMISDIIQQNKNFEQFAYIVSHNLRAPVVNILGISNVLKGELSNEDRIKTEQFLFSAVNQLDEIVKDLNKILSTKIEIAMNKETVHFSELVNGIKTSIQGLLLSENVEILTDFSAIDTIITLKSYIHSVFYNLILNSIKYKQRDKSPVIRITSEVKDSKIIISFKDNGSGIDLKQHGEKLFGLYKRFHLNIEGKGLGLFMVKNQIEALGGNISVKSEPKLGTEFIVELPV